MTLRILTDTKADAADRRTQRVMPMSRTLHHGDKAKQRKFEGRKGEKLKRSVPGWHWMTTPGWWTRLTMTAPQRRETRDILKKAGPDSDVMLPLPKRPHRYFW